MTDRYFCSSPIVCYCYCIALPHLIVIYLCLLPCCSYYLLLPSPPCICHYPHVIVPYPPCYLPLPYLPLTPPFITHTDSYPFYPTVTPTLRSYLHCCRLRWYTFYTHHLPLYFTCTLHTHVYFLAACLTFIVPYFACCYYLCLCGSHTLHARCPLFSALVLCLHYHHTILLVLPSPYTPLPFALPFPTLRYILTYVLALYTYFTYLYYLHPTTLYVILLYYMLLRSIQLPTPCLFMVSPSLCGWFIHLHTAHTQFFKRILRSHLARTHTFAFVAFLYLCTFCLALATPFCRFLGSPCPYLVILGSACALYLYLCLPCLLPRFTLACLPICSLTLCMRTQFTLCLCLPLFGYYPLPLQFLAFLYLPCIYLCLYLLMQPLLPLHTHTTFVCRCCLVPCHTHTHFTLPAHGSFIVAFVAFLRSLPHYLFAFFILPCVILRCPCIAFCGSLPSPYGPYLRSFTLRHCGGVHATTPYFILVLLCRIPHAQRFGLLLHLPRMPAVAAFLFTAHTRRTLPHGSHLPALPARGAIRLRTVVVAFFTVPRPLPLRPYMPLLRLYCYHPSPHLHAYSLYAFYDVRLARLPLFGGSPVPFLPGSPCCVQHPVRTTNYDLPPLFLLYYWAFRIALRYRSCRFTHFTCVRRAAPATCARRFVAAFALRSRVCTRLPLRVVPFALRTAYAFHRTFLPPFCGTFTAAPFLFAAPCSDSHYLACTVTYATRAITARAAIPPSSSYARYTVPTYVVDYPSHRWLTRA